MRLIDADELRRKMCYKCIDTDEETEKGRAKWDSGLWIRYKVFEDTLILAPTVDAEPMKHGYWIETYYEDILMRSTCSECGEKIANTEYNRDWQYCPYCGAKMDQEENT